MSLTGCKPSTDEVEESLKDRYGKDFYVGGLTPIDGGYSCLCYPIDNPQQLFDARINKDGSIYYDKYVAAMIADYYADYFEGDLDGLDGEIYVHGYRKGLLDNSESDNEVSELIKNKSFSFEDFYKAQNEKKGGKINTSSDFYIFISGSEDYKKEYEKLKNASYKVIDDYKNRYDLDIWVQLKIFYISHDDIDRPKQYYSQHADIKSLHEESLKNWTRNEIDMGFGELDKVPSDFNFTEEEYVEKRKEFK